MCVCVWESKKRSKIFIFAKKSKTVSASLYSYLIEVARFTQILCQRVVEPHGLSVNFFSGMRQSLSALLNICNETSLALFPIRLSGSPLSTQCRSMAEMTGTPAVIIASLDQYAAACVSSFFFMFQCTIYMRTGWIELYKLLLSKRFGMQKYSKFQSWPPSIWVLQYIHFLSPTQHTQRCTYSLQRKHCCHFI